MDKQSVIKTIEEKINEVQQEANSRGLAGGIVVGNQANRVGKAISEYKKHLENNGAPQSQISEEIKYLVDLYVKKLSGTKNTATSRAVRSEILKTALK